MDGQHRVEALKEYLKNHQNAEDEECWLCDGYNQGGSSFWPRFRWSFEANLTPGTLCRWNFRSVLALITKN